ncbi:MAG: DNA-3-methyladenine glycosylase [Gammaproteobacteria bacterium]|nr:MAG: DNA-3-methyladenine glycosylase [Gammaproteobacteria bacterium]
MTEPVKLSRSFYCRNDVVQISRELIGKVLCTHIAGEITKVLVTETEAYGGVDDRASHAYGSRRTKRTEPMFAEGGIAYVYLCYGIHHLFNVVTNEIDVPHAVLIRAAIPVQGVGVMLERRNKSQLDGTLLSGPGSVAQALAIRTDHTGIALTGGQLWIEDQNEEIDASRIVVGPRVGVDYAGEDAARPYRFVLK